MTRLLLFILAIALGGQAFAQTLPSPAYNNVTINGTATIPHAAITGGTITGLSAPVPLGSGGTGATTQSAALAAILGTSAIPVANGGTNTTSASGTALDNITGFASTGFLKRIGAGAYSFIADPIPVANGGTGASTQAAALTAILGSSTVPIANGGTNASTATGAATQLQYQNSATGGVARTYQGKFGDVVNVLDFGAKCDGSTIDTTAFNNAQTAVQNAGGGAIIVPATGHACVIGTGLALGNGVALVGQNTSLFAGTTATVAQWTAAGSWIQSTDTVNPTVTLQGHGSAVYGLNFIRSQPIPSATPSTPYTPTTFPCEILAAGDFQTVDTTKMIAVTCGLDHTLNAASGGGTYNHFSHIDVDAMAVGIRTKNVNDNVHFSDVHLRSMFYASNSNLVTYREANSIGWDAQYTDNPHFDALDCFQVYACVKFTNGTVLGNTHALYNGQIDKMQCNLVRICMLSATNATTFSFQIGQLQAQQDTANSLTDTLFQFGTNTVDAKFTNLNVITAGAQVMTIGNGAGGSVAIGSLTLGTAVSGSNVYGYSAVSAGQTAFSVGAGAILSIAQRNVLRQSTAGAFLAGAGAGTVQIPTFCWNPFATFGQASVTGTGAWADFTADNYTSTGYYGPYGFLQMRVLGNVNISTAQASGTASFRSGPFSTVVASGIPASTTGFQAFDSNWIDTYNSGVGIIGRIQQNMTSGVVAQFGDIAVCGR